MGKIKVLDTCQGSSFLEMQRAMGVLIGPKLELASYRVVVCRHEDDEFVLFADGNERVEARQNLGVEHEKDIAMESDQVNRLVAKLDQVEILDEIQGDSLSAIRAATPVFLKSFKARLVEYKIKVVRDGDSTVVIFKGKDRAEGARGHNPKCPAFEVELNSEDLSVIRSNFIR